MSFVLRMAVRETRASWRRLLFFFVCIAVGVAAIVALRSIIQSVRAVFSTEARSLIAADVLISTNRDWVPATRELIDRRLAAAGVIQQTESTETPTMVRPADTSRAVARMAELRAVQPGFPLYGTLELESGDVLARDAQEQGRPRAAGTADGARRQGRRPDRHRARAVHHSRRHQERAGSSRRRLQPGAARPHRLRRPAGDRAPVIRQPRPSRAARARARSADRSAGHDAQGGLQGRVRQRALVSRHRRRNRREFRSRRELPEHGRPGNRHPRRDCGIERDAGVRAAEDAQHRGAQVHWRAQQPDHRGLHAAGDGARPGRKPARRGAGAVRDCRHSLFRRDLGDVAPLRCALRHHLECCGAGHRHRRARLAAVLRRPAARGAQRQAVAAAARRGEGGGARLDADRGDRPRVGRPGLAHGLAGGVSQDRPDRQRRILRAGVRPAAGGARAGSDDCAARELVIVFTAARRAAHLTAGEPDARDPPRRRPGRLLHRRRADAAGEPARGLFRRDDQRRRGHVPDGRAARPGRRRSRVSAGSGQRGRHISADTRAAGPSHGRARPRDEARELRGRPRAWIAGARVHRSHIATVSRRTSG